MYEMDTHLFSVVSTRWSYAAYHPMPLGYWQSCKSTRMSYICMQRHENPWHRPIRTRKGITVIIHEYICIFISLWYFSVCTTIISLNIFIWTKDDHDQCIHTVSLSCGEFKDYLGMYSSVRVYLHFLVRTSSIIEQLIVCQGIYFY